MKSSVYADALRRLASRKGADEGKLVSNLIAHLAQTGRMKLLPAILRDLKTKEQQHKAISDSVEVAKASDEKKALAAAKEAGIDAKEASVNPSLLSGWRARSGGTLVDRSGKRQLIELYRNITR